MLNYTHSLTSIVLTTSRCEFLSYIILSSEIYRISKTTLRRPYVVQTKCIFFALTYDSPVEFYLRRPQQAIVYCSFVTAYGDIYATISAISFECIPFLFCSHISHVFNVFVFIKWMQHYFIQYRELVQFLHCCMQIAIQPTVINFFFKRYKCGL